MEPRTPDEAASLASDLLAKMVALAGPVWERAHDHDEFWRFLFEQGWSAIQTIAVIREVHGCGLRDAIDQYDSYWQLRQSDST